MKKQTRHFLFYNKYLPLHVIKGICFVVTMGFVLFSCQKSNEKYVATNRNVFSSLPATPQTTTIGLEIGNKAPDLLLKDTAGNFIRLSLLKKIVLVDFWASWCAPCRFENLKLKTIYQNYKDTLFKNVKGFEIYSVCVDANKTGWMRCIQSNHYNWKYNLIDSANWNETGAYLYHISSIPMNYLLDTGGVILAKNLRNTMVEKTLKLYLK
ncbi:MAG: TlpA family protein disulfide reductase [Bacteroidetes bacterium]|nr:TlpA family protein disulfide reductase [Bacteroidota bacterium]